MKFFSLKKLFSTSTIYKNPKPNLFPFKGGNRLQGVVLDFSGTTLDAHVIAPAFAFVKAFEVEGVNITMEEARQPMGLRKDLHIQKLLELPSVIEKWLAKKRIKPTPEDGACIFKHFLPIQNACLKEFSELLPGTLEASNQIKNHYKCKIGLTTGFTRESVNILLKEAESQGLMFDSAVAGDDIGSEMGFRPAPFMVWKNMEKFQIFDRRTIIKVDDTLGGVGEGLNAGVWTVGLYRYSNYTNINSIKEWKSMKNEEFEKKVKNSKEILMKSGAHYIADSMKDLPEIMEDINKRLGQGESP